MHENNRRPGPRLRPDAAGRIRKLTPRGTANPGLGRAAPHGTYLRRGGNFVRGENGLGDFWKRDSSRCLEAVGGRPGRGASGCCENPAGPAAGPVCTARGPGCQAPHPEGTSLQSPRDRVRPSTPKGHELRRSHRSCQESASPPQPPDTHPGKESRPVFLAVQEGDGPLWLLRPQHFMPINSRSSAACRAVGRRCFRSCCVPLGLRPL